jgi:hypothetical protein
MTSLSRPAALDSVAHAPALARPTLLGGLGWWIVLTCALKLALVSQSDIVMRYADEYGNAYIASGGYFGNPYGNYSHTRQPGYPLFLAAGTALGVPARLSMELVWLAAVSVVGVGLRRLNVPLVIAGAAIAVGAFAPSMFSLLARLLPDGLYAASFLVFIVALIVAAVGPASAGHAPAGSRWRWSLLAAVAAAINAHSRPESVLLFGGLALVGLLMVLRGVVQRSPAELLLAARALVPVIVLPLLAIVGSGAAIRQANLATVGLNATFDLDAPGFKSLYKALLEIPPKQPRLDLPIPRDVRDLAYANSPTLKQLEPYLDGDKLIPDYQNACFNSTGVKGEYGTWSLWGIRRAAFVMKQYQWKNAGELDAFFQTAADELRSAMATGALPRRFVLHPYIPPEWSQLATGVPRSVAACISVSAQPDADAPPDTMKPRDADLFNSVALRRPALDFARETPGRAPHLWHKPPVRERLASIQARLVRLGPPLFYAASAALLMALPLALLVLVRTALGRHPSPHAGLATLIVVAFALITARTLLLALVDATGVPSQHRYMVPGVVLAQILLPVTLLFIVRVTLLDPLRQARARTTRSSA